MKFHHRTQLNQWRRETPIQERVKVETNHYCTGENLIVRLRNKPNDKLSHHRANYLGSKWTNHNKATSPKRSAYLTYNNVMYFFCKRQTWFTKVKNKIVI